MRHGIKITDDDEHEEKRKLKECKGGESTIWRMDSSMPCGVNLARERETEGIAVLYVRPLWNPAKIINIPGPSTFSSSFAYALKSFCKKQLFQGSLKCNGNVFHSSNVCYVGAIDIT